MTHRKATIKAPITAGLSDVLGQGLLTAEGETWRQNRRLIAPSFQPRHLAEPGGERVGPLVEELMHGFNEKTHTWRRLLPEWVPTKGRRIAERNQRELHAILQELVAKKRTQHDPDASDLLSRLLAARDDEGRGMDDAQLRDEMLTLFLAGHETTALALSYAVLLLAKNPGLQERARQELDAVVGEGPLTAMHSRRLPFLDAVFQETMRLYPPAWVVGRAAAEPFVLGDVRVPAGTVLLLPQWVVHRDERWFPQADTFRPDRWLEDPQHPKYAFFPFGGGQRVCVGNHFARMEAVLVLAEWLRTFELAPVAGFELDVFPSVTPPSSRRRRGRAPPSSPGSARGLTYQSSSGSSSAASSSASRRARDGSWARCSRSSQAARTQASRRARNASRYTRTRLAHMRPSGVEVEAASCTSRFL
ncbi:MAG: cytochrome P450 [Proteobacteria bacterium]|nr:cytochrome P450 [Pseudomonadota bacterium]